LAKGVYGFLSRLSVRVSALVSVAPTGPIFAKFGIGTFHGNLSRDHRFGSNRTTILDVVREYENTFIANC